MTNKALSDKVWGLAYKPMLSILVAILTATTSQLAVATEYFVDITRPDDSGNGLTTNTAFKTIQAAVSRAAENDIVTVMPGEYAETPIEVTDRDNTSYKSLSRLYIDKKITLRSSGGASVTHIVGRHSSIVSSAADYADGMGDDAVRCISVLNGKNPTIQGFTIRDGASRTQNSSGVHAATGSTDSSRNRAGAVNTTGDLQNKVGTHFTLVDCVVSNNVGTRGGAIYGGAAVRCYFAFNKANSNGCAGRQASFYNCVLTRNEAGSKAYSAVGAGVIAYPYTIVNCTLVDNGPTYCFATATTGWIYNTLLINNPHDFDGAGADHFLNCIVSSSSIVSGGSSCAKANAYELINPLCEDFRLTAQAKSVGAGNKSYLDNIPDMYRDKDFYGKPRVTDDMVNVGAVQESVAVVSAIKLQNVNQENGSLCLNGRRIANTAVYACATSSPAFLRVTAAPASEEYGVQRYKFGGSYYWPSADDSITLVFPPSGESEVSVICKKIAHVSPTGNDTTGTGAAGNPYKTLQKGVSAGTGLVHASEGDYNEGGYYDSTYGVNNRLYISGSTVRVKAIGDRAKTIIWGGKSLNSPDGTGCGPDAVRCVLINSSNPSLVQGFTLKDGHVAYSSTYSDGYPYRGGCFMGVSSTYSNSTLADCVLTGGCAGRGAASFGGFLIRCVITNNVVAGTGNAILREGEAYSCLIADNDAKTAFVGGQALKLVGCTIAANRMDTTGNNRYTLTSTSCSEYNSVIGSTVNELGALQGGSGQTAQNCVVQSGSVPSSCVKRDPRFADLATGDYRVSSISPAVGLAKADTITCLSALDINGKLFDIDENGRYVAGCYADVDPYGKHWYVSPSGNDANDGKTRESPKKTLKAMMAKVKEGDTVHAARGTYEEGEFANGDDGVTMPFASATMKVRVFIPEGCKLVSDEGADVTFIKGYAHPGSANYGLGPNALKCVAMAKNTLLKGFTVCNGYSDCVNAEAFNNDGGGVYGKDASSVVEDCVIRECGGYRGGGMRYGTARRCQFLQNRALGTGAAAREAALYDSYIDGNYGSYIAYVGVAERCTFGPNNRSLDGTGTPSPLCFACVGNNACLKDCLFCDCGNVQAVHATNCVFQSQSTLNAMVNDPYWKDLKTAASIQAAGLIAWDGTRPIDGEGRPVKGCPAIDKALSDPASVDAKDASGNQRVYNNALDVGCYDYDCRGDYSRQICRRSDFAVVSAPPTCVLTDSGVLLLDGAMESMWSRLDQNVRFNLKVRVTGAGTLTISKDGVVLRSVTAADGEAVVDYKAAAHDLVFSYAKASGDTDEVGALISGLKPMMGLFLVVK